MRPSSRTSAAIDWNDGEWLAQRGAWDPLRAPISIYELHPGSWRRSWHRKPAFLTWDELADQLIPYVLDLGYTHVELVGVAEHPFDGSWGYQVLGHFAPTARHGTPHDFMRFVDRLHQAGIGVFMDWVPAHFPQRRARPGGVRRHALCTSTPIRSRGEHVEWGTKIFNYGRHEVRNFLVANALFWIEEYHIDGLRVDAVASMLYLDYGAQARRMDAEPLRRPRESRSHRVPEAAQLDRSATTFPGVLIDGGGIHRRSRA